MSTQDVAEGFIALCREGRLEEAGERWWADDVVSVEPRLSDGERISGKTEVTAKGSRWFAGNELHSIEVEGPWLNRDQFIMRFRMDFTNRMTGERRFVDEMALLTVTNGRISEERFFLP